MHKQRFSVPGLFKAIGTTLSGAPLLLDPKCDIVFKAIFTHGEKGRVALLGFLNAVLDFPMGQRVAKIEYLNTHAYDDQSISGEVYNRLKRCIAINILDYDLGTGLSEFHTCYRLHETTKLKPMPHPLTEIHFIELPKLKEYINGVIPRSILERWAFYFKDLPDNKYPEILDQILKDEKEIRMAEEARIKVSLMEKFLYSYRSYQRARLDEKSSLDYAHEEGLAEGRAEGKAEGLQQKQLEIARQLQKEGVSTEIIARSTGLSADEIGKL